MSQTGETLYCKQTKINVIKSKHGDKLFEIEEIGERWKEYIVELYNGEDIRNNRQYTEDESNVDWDMLDSQISRVEFDNALKSFRLLTQGPLSRARLFCVVLNCTLAHCLLYTSRCV